MRHPRDTRAPRRIAARTMPSLRAVRRHHKTTSAPPRKLKEKNREEGKAQSLTFQRLCAIRLEAKALRLGTGDSLSREALRARPAPTNLYGTVRVLPALPAFNLELVPGDLSGARASDADSLAPRSQVGLSAQPIFLSRARGPAAFLPKLISELGNLLVVRLGARRFRTTPFCAKVGSFLQTGGCSCAIACACAISGLLHN